MRLAAYVAAALVIVAGVTVGTVLGIGGGQGVYGVDNGQGGHWEKLSITQSGGSMVQPLVMDPRDSSILYAGSQDGLYKTTDGAATWRQILSFGSGSYYVILDPESPSTLYVVWSSWTSSLLPGAAQAEKLVRSDDGGNTWTELTANLVDAVKRDYKQQAWHVGGPLFGSGADGSAIYFSIRFKSKPEYPGPYWRSTDRGVTWALADAAERDRVIAAQRPYPSFLDEWHEYLVDAQGRVVGWPRSGVVDPNDPSVIYAGTGTGVCKSTDKGKTWTDASVGMTSEVERRPCHRSRFSLRSLCGRQGRHLQVRGRRWHLEADLGRRLLEKDDLWQQHLLAGYRSLGDIHAVCLDVRRAVPEHRRRSDLDQAGRHAPCERGYLRRESSVGTGRPRRPRDRVRQVRIQDLLRSTDGGDNWTKVLENIAPAESTEVAILADSNDPSTMYATTVEFATTAGESNEYAAVKSVDGGATWKTMIGSEKAGGPFELVLDPNDPAAIYRRQLRSSQSTSQSPEGGNTEDQVGLEDLKAVLSRSLDGGATWEQIDITGLPGLMMQLVCRSSVEGHMVRVHYAARRSAP